MARHFTTYRGWRRNDCWDKKALWRWYQATYPHPWQRGKPPRVKKGRK